jgi:hypothetical protein
MSASPGDGELSILGNEDLLDRLKSCGDGHALVGRILRILRHRLFDPLKRALCRCPCHGNLQWASDAVNDTFAELSQPRVRGSWDRTRGSAFGWLRQIAHHWAVSHPPNKRGHPPMSPLPQGFEPMTNPTDSLAFGERLIVELRKRSPTEQFVIGLRFFFPVYHSPQAMSTAARQCDVFKQLAESLTLLGTNRPGDRTLMRRLADLMRTLAELTGEWMEVVRGGEEKDRVFRELSILLANPSLPAVPSPSLAEAMILGLKPPLRSLEEVVELTGVSLTRVAVICKRYLGDI